MKPPKKKPLTLFAVVCKGGRIHETSEQKRELVPIAQMLDNRKPEASFYWCSPHRIVKLMEEP